MMNLESIPKQALSLNDRIAALADGEKLSIIEVRVGSDSDLPKIEKILIGLQDYPVLVRIASAHRTPEAMAELARAFPNVIIQREDDESDTDPLLGEDDTALENADKLKVILCIAAAGGSAHIAGMTASETEVPVIAFPVASSTNGQHESDASMRDMPPGIPNGTSAYESVIVDQAKAIYERTRDSSEQIYISPELEISPEIRKLIEGFGLQVVDTLDNSPAIGIFPEKVDDTYITHENDDRATINADLLVQTKEFGTPIAIVHPIYDTPIDTDTRTYRDALKFGIIALNRLTVPGLSMGTSVAGKTNLTNSVLFAAKVVAIHNERVRTSLADHRHELNLTVRKKDIQLAASQLQ